VLSNAIWTYRACFFIANGANDAVWNARLVCLVRSLLIILHMYLAYLTLPGYDFNASPITRGN
jgi:hypothetical protein